MARPLRIEYPGAFYHITSRGNERKRIYSTDRDKKKFLTYLKSAHKRFKTIVHTYCLMPNHYHLLLETPIANLSRCMQFINSSYTTYYNIKRERQGHLFQGRYKAILIDKDSYIEVLSRYIHLNPVRANMVKLPEQYPWNSYKFYISSKKAPEFLNIEFTLSYFGGSKREYRRFTEKGIAERLKNPFKELKASLILGSEKFVEEIKDKYLKDKKKSRDLPSLRQLKKDYITADEIIDILKKESNLKEKERMKWTIYFLRKYTGSTLKEILNRVHTEKLSISAVSQIAVRVEKKRRENARIDRELKRLETKMSNV